MFKKDEFNDEIETVIGPSVQVEGDFSAAGDIVIEGTVSGKLTTEKNLRLGQNGKIFANISVDNAVIAGEVQGNIKAKGSIELVETARVFGDIKAEVLSMTTGAIVHGKCQIGQVKKSKEIKSATKDVVEDDVLMSEKVK